MPAVRRGVGQGRPPIPSILPLEENPRPSTRATTATGRADTGADQLTYNADGAASDGSDADSDGESHGGVYNEPGGDEREKAQPVVRRATLSGPQEARSATRPLKHQPSTVSAKSAGNPRGMGEQAPLKMVDNVEYYQNVPLNSALDALSVRDRPLPAGPNRDDGREGSAAVLEQYADGAGDATNVQGDAATDMKDNSEYNAPEADGATQASDAFTDLKDNSDYFANSVSHSADGTATAAAGTAPKEGHGPATGRVTGDYRGAPGQQPAAGPGIYGALRRGSGPAATERAGTGAASAVQYGSRYELASPADDAQYSRLSTARRAAKRTGAPAEPAASSASVDAHDPASVVYASSEYHRLPAAAARDEPVGGGADEDTYYTFGTQRRSNARPTADGTG